MKSVFDITNVESGNWGVKNVEIGGSKILESGNCGVYCIVQILTL